MVRRGKIAPVVDRTFPLREAAEAMKYLRAGGARGKVVLAV
jgi:NADPH:quinone reductase-like Zn-dependent oxidoreductase